MIKYTSDISTWRWIIYHVFNLFKYLFSSFLVVGSFHRLPCRVLLPCQFIQRVAVCENQLSDGAEAKLRVAAGRGAKEVLVAEFMRRRWLNEMTWELNLSAYKRTQRQFKIYLGNRRWIRYCYQVTHARTERIPEQQIHEQLLSSSAAPGHGTSLEKEHRRRELNGRCKVIAQIIWFSRETSLGLSNFGHCYTI